ncbi:MAG: hypothetical protein LBI10_01865 [Deltaproteobacteria bacterium]|nr:hypothetical protein [Deltaproteobacteria bacterium]
MAFWLSVDKPTELDPKAVSQKRVAKLRAGPPQRDRRPHFWANDLRRTPDDLAGAKGFRLELDDFAS